MDVLKTADCVIDLGPDGGEAGGHILFSGTPEEISKTETDTGRYMKEELSRNGSVKQEEVALDLDDMTSDEEVLSDEIIEDDPSKEEKKSAEI